MSMHLVGPYMTTTSYKKRKSKKLDMQKLEVEWRKYNKRMRQAHCHAAQFETLQDYVDYVTGKVKKPKQEFVPYEPKTTSRRETKIIPSKSTESIPGTAAKRESPVYSGDYIIGIATMHKSNLVPVGRGDDPKHFATMRRN